MAGSVYLRNDGRWVAAITVNGRKLSRYAKTKTEAKTKLRELQKQPVEPADTKRVKKPDAPTLAAWSTQWLSIREAEVRPSTFRVYQQALAMLLPALGCTQLDKLTPLAISLTLADLSRQSRGKRQIQRAYTTLRLCLDNAVKLGLITSNPAFQVAKPKYQAQQREYWTLDQYRRFIDAALDASRKHSRLLAFLAVTGMRVSEVLALTKADINLSAKTVSITKALVETAGIHSLQPPKSRASCRVISLPAVALTILGSLPESSGYLFHDGCVPRQCNLSRELRKLCQEAGINYVNIHGLRHVAATTAIRATRDIHAVSRRLGHSHVSTTVGIYGYALVEDDNVADALDKLLSAGG